MRVVALSISVRRRKRLRDRVQELSIFENSHSLKSAIYIVAGTNSVIPLTRLKRSIRLPLLGNIIWVYHLHMNRLVPVAVLLALVVLPSAQAQMRGGFRSGAGFGRPAGAVRFGGGVHSFGHSSVVIGGRFGFGHNPRVGVFFGHPCCARRVFFRRHFITAFPYGYGYLPYYPYYADYPYSTEPAPATYYSARNDNSYDQGRIDQQLQDLRDQVQALREENAATSRGSRQLQPSAEQSKSEPLPPTTLVFHDGRREDVQNYAIVGDTLWILSENRARKRPLADLDVQATKQANSDRGVDFAVPARR